jgi:aldose 1-epimerase
MPVVMDKMVISELQNAAGMKARVLNYGATLSHLWMPDHKGNLYDVILGYENDEGYFQADNPYFNCTIGRYANRIANGQFEAKGRQFKLNNDGQKHCLHSGSMGFDKKFWEVLDLQADAITLQLQSDDGEGGFPGHLITKVTYRLAENNTLQLHYHSQCNAACPVNLTFHGYFNLGGADISQHHLMIPADQLLETDEALIPTGKILDVEQSPFDLRQGMLLANLLNQGIMLDHCYVTGIAGKNHLKAQLKGNLFSMDVWSNMPGLQVYMGNGLHTNILGVKNAGGYKAHAGICLEAQFYPDAPNHSHFPSPWLLPDQPREDMIEYRFTANG